MEHKSKEIDIIGYEGIFRVSSAGEVFSYPKSWVSGKGCPRSHGDIRMKTSIDHKGYEILGLRKAGNMKMFKVHRLVATHFIPNPDKKPQVNHKNGIKTDNRVDNLEWATHSENQIHARATGLNPPLTGEKHPRAKISANDAAEIRNSNLKTNVLAKKFSLSLSSIKFIRAGTRWKTITHQSI